MPSRNRLSRVWDELVVVEELDSGDAEHLALLTRPELGVTFSKIHAWRLVQYTKCVFLDADALVMQNVDELFEREELSAAPDIGWPDCFNSGVFVFEPSMEMFSNLLELARQTGSFDGRWDIAHVLFIHSFTLMCGARMFKKVNITKSVFVEDYLMFACVIFLWSVLYVRYTCAAALTSFCREIVVFLFHSLGGDQGLLNLYWSDWATKDIKYHLPFIYNVTPNVTYGYAPAFQRYVCVCS